MAADQRSLSQPRLTVGSPDHRISRKLSPVEIYYEMRTRRNSVTSSVRYTTRRAAPPVEACDSCHDGRRPCLPVWRLAARPTPCPEVRLTRRAELSQRRPSLPPSASVTDWAGGNCAPIRRIFSPTLCPPPPRHPHPHYAGRAGRIRLSDGAVHSHGVEDEITISVTSGCQRRA